MPLRRTKEIPKNTKDFSGEKILEVDASMQGSLVFKDSVNLKINGSFEGSLDIKGKLIIGENAQVKATIKGENIIIAGTVEGNIEASKFLELDLQARLTGDIKTPVLSIVKGAILNGQCIMHKEKETKKSSGVFVDSQKFLNVEELSEYLKVDMSSIMEWTEEGRIPAVKDKDNWKFEKEKIDSWVASNKIK